MGKSVEQYGEMEMPFGKHKGVKLKDVPAGYIQFIRKQDSHKFNLCMELWARANEEELNVRAEQEHREWKESQNAPQQDEGFAEGGDGLEDITGDVQGKSLDELSFDDDDIPF